MAVATPIVIPFEHPTDYRQEIAARPDRVRFLVIPERRQLALDGDALPGSEGFEAAIGSLFPVAYTLHFALRKRGIQAPIGALEGLYWDGEPGPIPAEHFQPSPEHRPAWRWRLMLPVPAEAAEADIEAAVDEVRAKQTAPQLDQLTWQPWAEGTVAQVMHVGPYADEPATIERLHAAILRAGLRPSGCHHEIYLSDPRRTKPERMKTLLRQPVDAA
jgi:hypothetical protein